MLQRTSDDHDPRKALMEAMPSMPGSNPGNESIDLREIVQIMSRRRRIVIVTALSLLMVALLFVFIVTPRYTATSTILIDPHRSSVVDSSNGQPVSSNFATDDAAANSQVSLIQSVAVLQRVVNDLKLEQDPEFGPHSSIFDPIKKLFARTRTLAPGQSAEDVAKAATLDFLQR